MRLLIKNGTILDGSGREEQQGDILIEDDIIKQISTNRPIKDKVDKTIEARDYFVAPGFIDINNESDHYLTLFTNPQLESLIFQGITTIIIGNNGSSLAPIFKENVRSIRKWGTVNINIDWQTMAEFLKKLEKTKLFVNVASFVGHSTIRRGIIGEDFRDLTDKELNQLILLISQSLKEGAVGISCGLKYNHSRQTPFFELLNLARLAKRYNVPIVFQPRYEKENLLNFIEEIETLIETLTNKNCPKIEITHLYVYKNIKDELRQSIFLLENFKNRGFDINFDLPPFTLVSNPLYLCFPSWFLYGNFEIMINYLKDNHIYKRLLSDLKGFNYDFSKMIVSRAQNNLSSFNGKSISYLAQKRNISNEEMLIELFKINDGRITIIYDELCWPELLGLLEHPLSIVSTLNPGLNYSHFDFLSHPASFNTFPRFLALVKEKRVDLSWAEAIRKITYEPALKIGLKKRGLLAKNYFADLVILDPQKLNSEIDLRNPIKKPDGIKYVIINGKFVIGNGEFKNTANGRVLKRS